MNPRFPLYIVSKGRWDTRYTSKALNSMGVQHHIVVEEQEYDQYVEAVAGTTATPIILDKRYQEEYDTCDDLGDTKSKGPGAARNFAWEHSMKNGHTWHWVMDDNITHFARLNKSAKVPVGDGTIFRCMEDFCLRYENVLMAGPNYCMFVPRKKASTYPPFIFNTRIYSCNLIRNDSPYRWRGRYNEDTDISLRMLKDGYCTIQFNAFMQNKLNTQKVKGGNTGEFYAGEGTLPKSKMQVKLHPDVSRLVYKFGRWHHHVDYRPYKKNKLRRKKGLEILDGIDNYGMKTVALET